MKIETYKFLIVLMLGLIIAQAFDNLTIKLIVGIPVIFVHSAPSLWQILSFAFSGSEPVLGVHIVLASVIVILSAVLLVMSLRRRIWDLTLAALGFILVVSATVDGWVLAFSGFTSGIALYALGVDTLLTLIVYFILIFYLKDDSRMENASKRRRRTRNAGRREKR